MKKNELCAWYLRLFPRALMIFQQLPPVEPLFRERVRLVLARTNSETVERWQAPASKPQEIFPSGIIWRLGSLQVYGANYAEYRLASTMVAAIVWGTPRRRQW